MRLLTNVQARGVLVPTPVLFPQRRRVDSKNFERTASQTSPVCKALGVKSLQQAKTYLQDVATSLLLAEAVYKILDYSSTEEALEKIAVAAAEFPQEIQQRLELQWSLPHVQQRYLVAEGETTIYVSFMGTKSNADLVTNAAILQELLWKEFQYCKEEADHEFAVPAFAKASKFLKFCQGEPAVHSGFLKRARSIPAKALLELAERKRKNLVLSGHSLGAAVAEICGLDLLHNAADGKLPSIQVIGFATPAIGNAALASFVRRKGWQKLLTNYLLPEDKIGRLLGSTPVEEHKSEAAEVLQQTDEANSPLLSSICNVTLQEKATNIPGKNGSQPLPPAVQGNIVAFHPLRPEKSERQKAERGVTESSRRRQGVLLRALKLIYKALTLPFWMHRAFVPVATRAYLNPSGVGPVADSSHSDAIATFLTHGLIQMLEDRGPGHLVNSDASALAKLPSRNFQARKLLLWMHRLPTYRARLTALCQSSLRRRSEASKEGLRGASQLLKLSDDVIPVERVSHASVRFILDGTQQPDAFHQNFLTRIAHSLHKSSRLKRLLGASVRGMKWAAKRQGPGRGRLLVCLVGQQLQNLTKLSLSLSEGKVLEAEINKIEAGRHGQSLHRLPLSIELTAAQVKDFQDMCQASRSKLLVCYKSDFHEGNVWASLAGQKTQPDGLSSCPDELSTELMAAVNRTF